MMLQKSLQILGQGEERNLVEQSSIEPKFEGFKTAVAGTS